MSTASAPEPSSMDDEDMEQPTGAQPVTLPSKTRLKITVKKLHVTAEWKWTQGGEDTCGICRMEFEAACTLCKFPGDDCPLVLGVCRHAFHGHCIDKWVVAPTNSARALCPLCRQDWRLFGSDNNQANPAPAREAAALALARQAMIEAGIVREEQEEA